MKSWLKYILLGIGSSLVVLILALGYFKENERQLSEPIMVLHVDGADALLTKKELYDRIISNRWFVPGQNSESLKIRLLEKKISQMDEVSKVNVYKFLGGGWKIEVWLRKPIARIFCKNGNSYYLDDEGATISKTILHTAKVLIFSGEINEPIKHQNAKEIINNDSLKNIRKLDEIYRISNYVCNDSMLRALIGQSYLEKNGDFVLIPIIGDLKIVFGPANSDKSVIDKFTRLKIFYKEGIPYEGWQKYTEINLKYDGQIVCRKRNKSE